MGKLLKRTAATIAGLGMAFSVVAATEAPADAAGYKITYRTYSTVKKGSHGQKARSVEALLRRAGYSASVNGRISAADVSAVKKFQSATRLPATGKVNGRTWSALIARGTTPTLSTRSAKSTSVRRLEAALRASGYPVKVDLNYGASTAKAVRAIQKTKGWKVTGVADTTVWKALQAGKIAKKLAKAKAKSTSSSAKGSSKGKRALAFAKRQIGDRYRYGGNGPNAWDCSGLTRGAWKSVGVSLPHSAAAQFRKGKKVSKSNLRPGDLVFFYSGIRHVAIYAGKGKVVHASQPGKPVATIAMKYMPYKGARRPA